jgi:hypothetical protein
MFCAPGQFHFASPAPAAGGICFLHKRLVAEFSVGDIVT